MDIVSIINNKVMENLNNNIVPWVCPYRRNGLPQNISGRNYNGINITFLSVHNFPSNVFLTFDQIKNKKGLIKQGEKSSFVVGYFPKKYQVEKTNDNDELEFSEKSTYVLRYFNVFNISQTTLYKKDEELPASILYDDINKFIEYVSNNICPIKLDSAEIPCYIPEEHIIKVPSKSNFNNDDEFYSTLFHEIIHSTMKPLERKKLEYSLEELVAEMGCSMLCQMFGILQTIDNSISYIQSWIKYLSDTDHKQSIITAGNKAGKAFNFLIEHLNTNKGE